MGKATNPIPTYRRHPNGQAFVYHKSIANKSHRLYLGKHGSEESLRRYRQLLRRLESIQLAGPAFEVDDVPTIRELILAYDDFAPDSTPPAGRGATLSHTARTSGRPARHPPGRPSRTEPRGRIARTPKPKSSYYRGSRSSFARRNRQLRRGCERSQCGLLAAGSLWLAASASARSAAVLSSAARPAQLASLPAGRSASAAASLGRRLRR